MKAYRKHLAFRICYQKSKVRRGIKITQFPPGLFCFFPPDFQSIQISEINTKTNLHLKKEEVLPVSILYLHVYHKHYIGADLCVLCSARSCASRL